MFKKVLLLFIICILLVSCQKNNVSDDNVAISQSATEYVEENTAAELETIEAELVTTARKDISEYEDCTVVIPGGTFKEIAENANLIPDMITACFGYSYDTIEELYGHSQYAVRGKIVDLTYVEDKQFGVTAYSFAVKEVLSGEGIEPETIVSLIDNQGYVRLTTYRKVMGENLYSQYSGEEADRTYLVRTSGEPLVEIGEEYVLFLFGERSIWGGEELEGNFYEIVSPFVGKFKLNEDGLYERSIPEYERHLYKLNKPLSLEEIKEQIAEAEKSGNEKK